MTGQKSSDYWYLASVPCICLLRGAIDLLQPNPVLFRHQGVIVGKKGRARVEIGSGGMGPAIKHKNLQVYS